MCLAHDLMDVRYPQWGQRFYPYILEYLGAKMFVWKVRGLSCNSVEVQVLSGTFYPLDLSDRLLICFLLLGGVHFASSFVII